MSGKTKLAAHPRLYLGDKELARLRAPMSSPLHKAAQNRVTSKADSWCKSPEPVYNETGHNAHLVRARMVQTQVVTWLARYVQTGQEKYRTAVLNHIQMIHDWEYWSWITWRQNNPRPDAIFDLSYGENSATLAIAYDLLHETLSETEKQLFIDTAKKWTFASVLAQLKPRQKRINYWWFGHHSSNWATVCAGGLGMLCLALYDECPEARKILPYVEEGFKPYMNHLKTVDGGWDEGLGYWNYGMRYAFMYLLSHERATGKQHPLMKQAATKKTLYFPLDFFINGVALGFNDCNGWAPLPFHYATAARLGCADVVARLDDIVKQQHLENECWPNAAEFLLLHPGATKTKVPDENNVVRLYKGLHWALMADSMPTTKLACTIRGGTAAVPHGHCDPLSFNLAVNDEAMLYNPQSGAYLDTTFSGRRWELYDLSPAAKNGLMVNGVGITTDAQIDIRELTCGKMNAIRLDGTQAFGQFCYGAPTTSFCGRVFLMLDDKGVLIIDRVALSKHGLVEARFHTAADVRCTKSGAQLSGKREKLRMTFASTAPMTLIETMDPLIWPVAPTTLLRWMTPQLRLGATFATLLTPGAAKATLRVEENEKGVTVQASVGKTNSTIRLTPALLPHKTT